MQRLYLCIALCYARQAEEEEAERVALERHSTQLAARQTALQTEHAALVESHDRLRLLVTREQTRAEFLLGCVVAWAALQAPGIRSLVSTPVPAHLCLHLRLHTRAGPTHTHATVYTRGPEASKPVLPCQ